MQQKSKQQLFDELIALKEKHGLFVFKEGNRSRYIFPGDELPWWITKNDIPKYRILNRAERNKLQNKKMPYGDVQPKPNLRKRFKIWVYRLRIRLGIIQMMFLNIKDKYFKK